MACNIILKNSQSNKNLQKSIIFDVEGTKVGLVGYLTPDSNILDSTDNIEYVDEIIALNEEVAKLREQNINIIIALGHSSREKGEEIANEVDDIDIVINGHKNTFYLNGENSNKELPNIEEPRFIIQKSGKQVLFLESYSYDKYLGYLSVEFDSNGDIASYNVDPLLLDILIPQDADAVQILSNLNEELKRTSEEVVGSTAVVLDGTTCKTAECNLGNLITDAIMYYYAVRYNGDTWSDAPIAIIHSDAIADSIAPSNRPASILRGDLLSALPLESNIVAVTMSGDVLTQLLEQTVNNYSIANPIGQLLQFSGVRAEYDMSKEPGSRLVSAVVRCWSCFVPEFYTIDGWRTYKILMPAALANGEYGYSMLVGLEREELVYDEVTCLEEYIRLRSPVYPEVAERLVLNNLDSFVEPNTTETTTLEPTTLAPVTPEATTLEPTTAEPDSATAVTSTLTLLFFVLVPMFI